MNFNTVKEKKEYVERKAIEVLKDFFYKNEIGNDLLLGDKTEYTDGRLFFENIDYQVAKKTLIKTGLEKSDLKNIEMPELEGSVAAAFGYDDEATPAKLINDFSKTNKKLVILGGLMNGQFIGADQVKTLAKLPGREQLLAQVVGTIQAPVSGFARVLSGNIRNLVGVLNNIKLILMEWIRKLKLEE